MKKNILSLILISLFLAGCEKKEDQTDALNYSELMYISYYAFAKGSIIGTDCYGSVSFNIDSNVDYDKTMELEFRQKAEGDDILIYQDGELFLTGTNPREEDDLLIFDIEEQETYFLGETRKVWGGFEGDCETHEAGSIMEFSKDFLNIELNICFGGTYQGNPNILIMASFR